MAHVCVIGANLMFASKVLEAAKALGLDCASGPASMDVSAARMVCVDVERVAADELRALRGRTSARLIGFASHVNEEAIAAARDAGCEVLSRGQFSAQLPKLLESIRTA